jgi:catechol 2,3-dioxygenase-like lactoylglutathione lyase family enzyme
VRGARVDHHVALRVSDMDRAIRFWETALGAEVAVRPTVERRGGYFDLLFYPGVRLNIAHLRFAEGGGLELFETIGETFPGAPSTFTHFGVVVEDVAAALGRIEETGGRRVNDVTSVGDDPDGLQFCYCQDPDGNTFEMWEVDHQAVIDAVTDRLPETRP